MPLESLRRILVLRLDNIGDVVMAGPALRALKATWPQAELTFLVSPAGAHVTPLLPWVDHVLVQRTLWQDLGGRLPFDPQREQAFIARLREGRFDLAVIFTSFSQSPYGAAYACYLAGIPRRVGQARDFGGGLLSTCVTPAPDAGHQVDRNLHLARALGCSSVSTRLELAIPDDVAARADALLAGIGIGRHGAFIALAPGASCAARRYDPHRYAEVARRLAQRGLPVVIVGNEADRAMTAEWARLPGVQSLAGATRIPELAAILRRAQLVIGNNSGPMHIADAFARPQVVLYSGSEHESQWAPRASPLRLLRRDTACSPCYAFTCPYDMECLDISANAVVDAALDLLATDAPVHAPSRGPTQGVRLCGPSVY